jgi:hypothetical protein
VKLKNAQKRLSRLQRMTCLGILGGMRSTPTSALEVMLMLSPFLLLIKLYITNSTGVLETVVSMESSSVFVGPELCLALAPSCVKRRERGYLNHTAPHGA